MLKRKQPLKRTVTRNMNARKLRPVAKRKVATVRKANKERAAFCLEVGFCMNCGNKTRPLVCHELVRGANRYKGIQERLVQLVLCGPCHDQLHRENWTLARQISIRRFALPNETGVRESVNRLRGRARDAVSEEEVNQCRMKNK